MTQVSHPAAYERDFAKPRKGGNQGQLALVSDTTPFRVSESLSPAARKSQSSLENT